MAPRKSKQQQEPQVAPQVQPRRDFVIPKCDVIVQGRNDTSITVEDLHAIALQLTFSNPGAKVDFWIRVEG